MIADCLLLIGDCKRQIADCGLRIADCNSSQAISNQPSAISNLSFRRRRRGLSYLEVLIAAGIALMGILGAVALFPVAILNMQKGQVVDQMAAIGPSALNGAKALGVTDSSNWLAYNAGIWNVSGVPQAQPSALNLPAQPGMWISLCFDPRFAAESTPPGSPAYPAPYLFPFQPQVNADDVRMARLTLRSTPGSFMPMSVAQARNLFKVADDLMFLRPDDATVPAQQLPIESSGPVPAVRRNYMADYEYIVTLTPSLRGVPVGYVPNDPTPYSYVLGGVNLPESLPMDVPSEYTMSAVVFYKRQVSLNAYIPGDNKEPDAERVTNVVSFWNSGFNGGDITIQCRTPIGSAVGNELEVHQGDWVMLSGNMYAQNAPRKFLGPLFQWYRVASVNGDSYPDATSTYHQRDLTLDGPDWPTTLVPTTQLSIISGVVGVFSTPVQVK